MNSTPCPFCRIIAGEDPAARVVYEDEHTLAFFPLNPATRGHTLVVPRRHVSDVWGLTQHEGEQLARTTQIVAHAVHDALTPSGLNLIQSNGEVATQTVGHVHVHVVPRYNGDRLRLRWPKQAAEHGADLSRTLSSIQAHLPQAARAATANSPAPVSEDDRRQHLEFIQSVITRMSQASSTAKTWLLPIVTAAYGYALIERDLWVGLLGLLAVVTFGLLDANYLKQEKAFRRLYDVVASGAAIPHFSMNPTLAAPTGTKANYWPDWAELRSWAIAPVYLPLLIAGLAIVARALLG
ncbi:HIT family protein [Cellulosimicrobium cellulans]|uniref:HIT family protein n=1 Tax=Cellulosimicrobium cellulans TaxID=1710 RepID=UPI0036EBC1A6